MAPRAGIDRRAAQATTRPAHPPEQLVRAATVPGRGPVTETLNAKLSPLARRAEAAAPPPRSQQVLRPEQPVRAHVPPKLSPSTVAATTAAPVRPMAAQLLERAREAAPETPTHDYLEPATSPAMAAANRRRRKRTAIERGRGRPVSLGAAGPSATDLANGVQTPLRGAWTINGKAAPAGTPIAVREAPIDELPVLTASSSSPVPETAAVVKSKLSPLGISQPWSDVDVSTLGAEPLPVAPASPTDGPGEGAGRLVFLAGALFVAWLVLGKGAA